MEERVKGFGISGYDSVIATLIFVYFSQNVNPWDYGLHPMG
jgi:hypothetical protein